ncbi:MULTISPECIES: cytochrome D1 domain-containing protein [unclassified Halomonas]|uniref:cytochrome D1 domain-containing protein n=1 Tax=unclassified Halomonas TaxID=2609666 RepID=UPI0028845227|nr:MULTISPECIES: cytochrome D1 domain-containing protein [unclassified Halomonas]MDT0499982.1 cytochrome D1 domain-containing protein [Halomonas sp. PAR7]MDT0512386.1 cytochrome D1 domain-containing protein [Halomonas sp. LES1]MDT0591020.1 cytochrome D1 domain-containing protein [Halomonas sp. PAR8]
MKYPMLPWMTACLLGGTATLAAAQETTDGAALYDRHCAACHQPSGEGVSGVFPPHKGHVGGLYAAEGEPDGRTYLAQVLHHGLTGPIVVDGVAYDGNMPAWGGALSDAQIAEVLNYMLTGLDPAAAPENFRPYRAEEIAALGEEALSGRDVHRLRRELAGFAETTPAAEAGADAAAPQTAASEATFPEPAYVAVQNSSIIQSLPAGAAWPEVPGAHYDALSPDGTRLLVSGFKTGDVYVMDARSGELTATLPIGEVAQGVKIAPDGCHGLAVAPGQGIVAVIDLDAGELIKTIPVGKEPHNAVFTADGSRAYVTLQGGGAIAVIDMASLEKVDEIPTPGLDTPHNLDLSEDSRRLWIRDFVGQVGVLDLESRTLVETFAVGNGHGGIDVVPGGRYVATGAIADSTVTVIDAQAMTIAAEVEVGTGPHGVRASRDGRYLYASITGDNTLAVIDTETLEVVQQVPVDGAFPFWIAVPGNP